MYRLIVAGCDVGSTTGKAVIIKDHTIAAYTIIPCKTKPEETARLVISQVVGDGVDLGLVSGEPITPPSANTTWPNPRRGVFAAYEVAHSAVWTGWVDLLA